MQHTHDASTQRAPRARVAAVPQVLQMSAATSLEVALLFALPVLLALLVLLL